MSQGFELIRGGKHQENNSASAALPHVPSLSTLVMTFGRAVILDGGYVKPGEVLPCKVITP